MTDDPDATRARLARAAGELLDDGGPPAVTMRAVAARAGVSTMATYRHFADRDALISHLVDAAFAELGDRFARPRSAGPPADRTADPTAEPCLAPPSGALAALHGMLDDLLDLALARPHLFALAFTDRRDDARLLPAQAGRSPTLAVVVGALSAAMADGTLRPDDPAEVAVGFAALVQGLWLARHAGRIALDDAEFRAFCHRSADRMIDGLRA